jgi:hypothetical protein
MCTGKLVIKVPHVSTGSLKWNMKVLGNKFLEREKKNCFSPQEVFFYSKNMNFRMKLFE